MGTDQKPNLHAGQTLKQVQGDNKKCHSEFTALLVADYKEAYKGGCSKSISGSYQLGIKTSSCLNYVLYKNKLTQNF